MANTFDGKYGVTRTFEKLIESYDFDRLHFIAGCGFESRTTRILELLSTQNEGKVDCTIVDLMNKKDPSFPKARRFQKPNMVKMRSIIAAQKWRLSKVAADLYSERFFAHRALLNTLAAIPRKHRGDFLVDISCMPRSVAFPALRFLWQTKRARNLFVAFTDDPSVGHLESQAENYRPPFYVPHFAPPPTQINFKVWLPILGSDYRPIRRIWNDQSYNDIYPVVGFPSSMPLESDEIVRRNKAIIFGRTDKVIFASMNDPFQLSMKLNMLIDEIRGSLGPEIRMIISPHGSKPQSIGAFLTSVIKDAGILYCQPLSYDPKAGMVGQSHVYWLKGQAYHS